MSESTAAESGSPDIKTGCAIKQVITQLGTQLDIKCLIFNPTAVISDLCHLTRTVIISHNSNGG